MRRWLVLGSVGLVVAAWGGTAAARTPSVVTAKSKPKAPVALPGKLNNKGTKTVKGNRITIEQHDYYFRPTFVKAKPGAVLTITVKNDGTQEHTFTVPGQAVDADLQLGKKATVHVTVPSDGAITFYCRLHGPNGTAGDLGMQGAIFTQTGQTVTNAVAASPTPTTSPSATQASVKVADSKFGKILVDATGATLYVRDSDTPTQVSCTGGCATAWPPLIATGTPQAGDGVDASKLATINGPNGIQVTYAGHPLYRFASDHAAGDATGQGVGGFFVIGPDGQKVTAMS